MLPIQAGMPSVLYEKRIILRNFWTYRIHSTEFECYIFIMTYTERYRNHILYTFLRTQGLKRLYVSTHIVHSKRKILTAMRYDI